MKKKSRSWYEFGRKRRNKRKEKMQNTKQEHRKRNSNDCTFVSIISSNMIDPLENGGHTRTTFAGLTPCSITAISDTIRTGQVNQRIHKKEWRHMMIESTRIKKSIESETKQKRIEHIPCREQKASRVAPYLKKIQKKKKKKNHEGNKQFVFSFNLTLSSFEQEKSKRTTMPGESWWHHQ